MKEEDVLAIGTSLVKVTRQIDKSLGGMILNTYLICLLMSTTNMYVVSSLFFNKHSGMEIYFMCCASMFLTILSMMRILYHTSSGQCLASAMKECGHTLDSIKMTKIKNIQEENFEDLLRDGN